MKRSVLVMMGLSGLLCLQAQTTMNLQDFRELALKANKSMQISQENAKAATELKKAAFTQFLPKIQAYGSYQWNEKNISLLAEDALLPVGSMAADGSFAFRQDQISNKWMALPDGSYAPLDADGVPFNPTMNPEKIQWKDYAYLPKESMEFDIHNIFVGGIGFTQPLFLGFKIKELYNIAKTTEKMAATQRDDQVQKLLIEVDEDYWRVVSVYNKRELARNYVKLLEKLNSNVNALVAEGVATKADALSVKVKLNEAQMSLSKAENGYELSKMVLCQLCGLNLNSEIRLADFDLDQPLIVPVPLKADSLAERRSEIKLLGYMKDIAKANVGIMASRFMPNVLLTGNYLVSNPNVFNGFDQSFSGMFNIGVTFTMPIFHWGDEVHTLRAAKCQYRIAQYQLDDAKEKIEMQITQQTFKLNEANKKAERAFSNMTSADENLRTAEEAFSEGVIGATELMAAQTAWLSANSEKIDASIDLRLCDLYLRKAQGQSIE